MLLELVVLQLFILWEFFAYILSRKLINKKRKKKSKQNSSPTFSHFCLSSLTRKVLVVYRCLPLIHLSLILPHRRRRDVFRVGNWEEFLSRHIWGYLRYSLKGAYPQATLVLLHTTSMLWSHPDSSALVVRYGHCPATQPVNVWFGSMQEEKSRSPVGL